MTVRPATMGDTDRAIGTIGRLLVDELRDADVVQHDHLRLSFSRASEPDIDEGIARIARAVAAAPAT